MRKIMNALKGKGIFGVLNLCAMAVVIQSVSSCCFWAQHQPKLPEEAKRFKKF